MSGGGEDQGLLTGRDLPLARACGVCPQCTWTNLESLPVKSPTSNATPDHTMSAPTAASSGDGIIDPDEDDFQMMLRIEAEERARLEEEWKEEDVQTLQPTRTGGTSMAERLRGCLGGSNGASGGSSAGGDGLGVISRRFALLGLKAFGGSPAQVALMRSQPWREDMADDAVFASLVALCECLPGFTASQLATALGVIQAGSPYGGLVALASYSAAGVVALALIGCVPAWPASWAGGAFVLSLRMGLGAAGLSLVAKSTLSLFTALVREPITKAIAIGAAAIAVCLPGSIWLPAVVLALSALASATDVWWKRRNGGEAYADAAVESAGLREDGMGANDEVEEVLDDRREAIRSGREPSAIVTAAVPIYPRGGMVLVALWFAVWLVLLFLRSSIGGWPTVIAESHYRSGSMVFGGGAPVLPLLLREVTPEILPPPPRAFLEGIAFANALPGAAPFNVAAYVGATYAGVPGGLLAAAAVYLPSGLLLYAALPFWVALRTSASANALLRGVGAASAGMLLAATLDLFCTAATSPAQHAVAILTFASMQVGWPASRLRVPARYHAPLAVGMGTALGVPFCLPWIVSQPLLDTPDTPLLDSTDGPPLDSTNGEAVDEGIVLSPPPMPFPPDPSPPPPPMPRAEE